MMEPNQILRKVYALYLADGGTRVPVMEQYLDIVIPDVPSVDDHRNASDFYRQLVESQPKALDEAFRRLLSDMHGLPYEHSAGLLDALRFLQNILAIALWKYQLPVSEELERFARAFDRLDVAHVRRRLYEEAQI